MSFISETLLWLIEFIDSLILMILETFFKTIPRTENFLDYFRNRVIVNHHSNENPN